MRASRLPQPNGCVEQPDGTVRGEVWEYDDGEPHPPML